MAIPSGKWVLHIIPNTHWDREWYMSFERYRWRLVKLMDLLLDLMEAERDYRTFTLDGQFLPVKDYLEVRPEREPAIRKLVKDGRLRIGPWYSQPLETAVLVHYSNGGYGKATAAAKPTKPAARTVGITSRAWAPET